MNANQIKLFRERLKNDPENLLQRRQFHEQYEWLEAYIDERYSNNHIERFSNEFGKFLWKFDEIKSVAHSFALYPPIGSSSLGFEPTLTIKRATFHLLYFSGVLEEEFPEINNDKEIGQKWMKNSFNALFVIVKQIRDNLFHGKKIEIEEEQYQRNKELITLGVEFTTFVLEKLEDAENQ